MLLYKEVEIEFVEFASSMILKFPSTCLMHNNGVREMIVHRTVKKEECGLH